MIRFLLKWSKLLVLLIWVALLFVVGAHFAQGNDGVVSVQLFGWSSPDYTLGALLVGTFVLGLVIGAGLMIPSMTWSRFRLRRLVKLTRQHPQKQERSLSAKEMLDGVSK